MADYGPFRLSVSPGWLQGPNATAYFGLLGSIEDNLYGQARQAVRSRFPLVAPADALLLTGAERQLPRAVSSTDAAYAARLVNAWAIWQSAGTAMGVLSALSYAGYPNAILAQAKSYAYSLDGSGNLVTTLLNGGGWLMDSPSFWSKFTVLFTQPLPVAWMGPTPAFGPVTHFGTVGTGTVAVAAGYVPTVDVRIVVAIVAGGTAGIATFKWSSDGGQTWSATATTSPGSPMGLGTSGAAVIFSGSLWSGESYSFAPLFPAAPADGSSEAVRIKSVVNSWKPAMATVARYVVHTGGNILGWPVGRTLGQPYSRLGGTTLTWTA